MSIDADAILAEVRARVRAKRESGVYGPEVDAALHAPLPGGAALLVDDLADPHGSLGVALTEYPRYEPRSRRPVLGPLITFARRLVIGLARPWLATYIDRQERINRLVAAALAEGRNEPSAGLRRRLERLEEALARRESDDVGGLGP